MRTLAIAMAATAVLSAAPLATAKADPIRTAQVGIDVQIGGDGYRHRHRGPGIIIDTEGRGGSDCRTVTVSEWRNGVQVTRTERRCD